MITGRVLLVPGSVRADSLHRRLAAALAPLFEAHGLSVEIVDLRDHPMPIYDGDAERELGPPAAAVELQAHVAAADAVVFLTPEYNGGPPALLKNTIDWVTRVDRTTFRRPLIGLAATSPGGRGAVHGLDVMRRIFGHMGLTMLDGDLSVPDGADAFELSGGPGDGPSTVRFARDGDRARAEQFVTRLADLLAERAATP
jgi:NAD(P)H-dependent FMN reductase